MCVNNTEFPNQTFMKGTTTFTAPFPHRLGCVLKHPPGLLVGAHLLHALPLKPAWHHQLQVPFVPEQRARRVRGCGLLSKEHWTQKKRETERQTACERQRGNKTDRERVDIHGHEIEVDIIALVSEIEAEPLSHTHTSNHLSQVWPRQTREKSVLKSQYWMDNLTIR